MDVLDNFQSKKNESDQKINESDSLVIQPLPSYHREQNDESEKNDSDDDSQQTDAYKTPSQITMIKTEFFRVRDQVFQNTPYQRKIAIKIIPEAIDHSQKQISILQELKVQESTQIWRFQNFKEFEKNHRKLDDDIYFAEDINTFKKNIKQILSQEKLIEKQREPPVEIKNQLIKKLTEKSQSTLDKLKPYLVYHLNKIQQENTNLQEVNLKLEAEQKIYNEEADKQNNFIKKKQVLKRIYEIQAEIENERNYGRGLEKFAVRHENDLQMRKNKDN